MLPSQATFNDQRLGKRKGEKIAKVAMERKLLEWIYHMLEENKKVPGLRGNG